MKKVTKNVLLSLCVLTAPVRVSPSWFDRLNQGRYSFLKEVMPGQSAKVPYTLPLNLSSLGVSSFNKNRGPLTERQRLTRVILVSLLLLMGFSPGGKQK